MAPPRVYCCLQTCINSSIKRPDLSFFKLPSDDERRSKWLQLIAREDLANKKAKSYVVCEEHFEVRDILRAEQRKNLKKEAVPSLKLPNFSIKIESNPEENFEGVFIVANSTQTEATYPFDAKEANSNVPLKRKLNKIPAKPAKNRKLNELDKETEREQLDLFYKLCDKFLTQDFGDIIKAQANPRSAHKKTLPITTEVNDKVMLILKTKVESMTDKEKNCSVMIDVMDLKKNVTYSTKDDRITGFHEVDGIQSPKLARSALVVMARGIFVNWKQPIGFALLEEFKYEEISRWLENLLTKLFDIGLNIRTFVTDMSPDMCYLAAHRTISGNKPFYYINYRKILHIFNAPDLIKMTRDSLLEHEFHFQGTVATFQPIAEFFNQDKDKSCRIAPKLTRNHINPTIAEKNETRYAVQLFSNTVAAGIHNYIDFYVIDESGRDTVKLIKLMNDLFDVLNSSNLKENCENRKPFRGEDFKIKILDEALLYFQKMQLVDPTNGNDVTSEAAFIKGFIITIKSIFLLYEDLRLNKYETLMTERLNKNAIEAFLRKLKSIIRMNTLPTSRQFVLAFHEEFVKHIVSEATCPVELAQLFINIEATCPEGTDSLGKGNIKTEEGFSDPIAIEELESKVKIKTSDYRGIDIPKKNAHIHVCISLLNRCKEEHEHCEVMHNYLYPCDNFKNFVDKMEEKFSGYFLKTYLDNRIAAAIYKEFDDINFVPPCPCFPVVFLKKLFIRLRIYDAVKSFNKAGRPQRNRGLFVQNLFKPNKKL